MMKSLNETMSNLAGNDVEAVLDAFLEAEMMMFQLVYSLYY